MGIEWGYPPFGNQGSLFPTTFPEVIGQALGLAGNVIQADRQRYTQQLDQIWPIFNAASPQEQQAMWPTILDYANRIGIRGLPQEWVPRPDPTALNNIMTLFQQSGPDEQKLLYPKLRQALQQLTGIDIGETFVPTPDTANAVQVVRLLLDEAARDTTGQLRQSPQFRAALDQAIKGAFPWANTGPPVTVPMGVQQPGGETYEAPGVMAGGQPARPAPGGVPAGGLQVPQQQYGQVTPLTAALLQGSAATGPMTGQQWLAQHPDLAQRVAGFKPYQRDVVNNLYVDPANPSDFVQQIGRIAETNNLADTDPRKWQQYVQGIYADPNLTDEQRETQVAQVIADAATSGVDPRMIKAIANTERANAPVRRVVAFPDGTSHTFMVPQSTIYNEMTSAAAAAQEARVADIRRAQEQLINANSNLAGDRGEAQDALKNYTVYRNNRAAEIAARMNRKQDDPQVQHALELALQGDTVYQRDYLAPMISTATKVKGDEAVAAVWQARVNQLMQQGQQPGPGQGQQPGQTPPRPGTQPTAGQGPPPTTPVPWGRIPLDPVLDAINDFEGDKRYGVQGTQYANYTPEQLREVARGSLQQGLQQSGGDLRRALVYYNTGDVNFDPKITLDPAHPNQLRGFAYAHEILSRVGIDTAATAPPATTPPPTTTTPPAAGPAPLPTQRVDPRTGMALPARPAQPAPPALDPAVKAALQRLGALPAGPPGGPLPVTGEGVSRGIATAESRFGTFGTAAQRTGREVAGWAQGKSEQEQVAQLQPEWNRLRTPQQRDQFAKALGLSSVVVDALNRRMAQGQAPGARPQGGVSPAEGGRPPAGVQPQQPAPAATAPPKPFMSYDDYLIALGSGADAAMLREQYTVGRRGEAPPQGVNDPRAVQRAVGLLMYRRMPPPAVVARLMQEFGMSRQAAQRLVQQIMTQQQQPARR